MPVQDDAFEKWPAEKHDEPVAIDRHAFTWGGYIIKIFHTVAEPAPDSLQAEEKDEKQLRPLKGANVFQSLGKPGIDVIAFDP